MTSYFIQVHPFRLEFIFVLLVLFSELIVVSIVIESFSPEFFTILWGLSRRKTSDRAPNSLHKQFLRQLDLFWVLKRHLKLAWKARLLWFGVLWWSKLSRCWIPFSQSFCSHSLTVEKTWSVFLFLPCPPNHLNPE